MNMSGRMFCVPRLSGHMAVMLAVVVGATFAGCSHCSSSRSASEAELKEAYSIGANRAHELDVAEVGNDTVAIEAVLIDVRAREQKIRNAGYPDIADAYVEGFISALDSVNPSLATEIK